MYVLDKNYTEQAQKTIMSKCGTYDSSNIFYIYRMSKLNGEGFIRFGKERLKQSILATNPYKAAWISYKTFLKFSDEILSDMSIKK